jgi:tRNA (adenine57-N1/adenine58-N1)-methyltransferase
MIKEGDIIRLEEISLRHPKSWIIKLTKNGELSTHLGKIFHDQCIGCIYGDVILLTRGTVTILKPLPRDYLRHFRLKTQILYEDDCSIACTLAGVGPGMRVGEAGTGSGGLTIFLAYYVQPNGHIYSFDINYDHLSNAKQNIEITGLSKYVTFLVKDVRKPLDIENLDAFFLDFSTPYDAIDNVVLALKGGGHLVCFVPNWSQVEKTVAKIQENPSLILKETFEVTRRNYVVNPTKNVMRPVFRDLVYSGILIHGIKIIPKQ